ncbi:hypothetical protein GCM10012287_04280 [Streptomyces daqingensis]|uniref:Uncharacterized protein n=1 Tax=Streptomyces daqingensis TaxID=1472640 RepID=A0ABQ2LSZ2_9ACTN|nr:hypothetical protein [Streptomyces daqingensis]GGO42727.1 hypothetical protein GCM10012287_04280 [Streptomyces daqingensis]
MTADGSTDRREKYARALYSTLGFSAERHPWTTLAPARREVWYQRADAAISLADEEIAEAVRDSR